jgi:uncharacterized protein YjiK
MIVLALLAGGFLFYNLLELDKRLYATWISFTTPQTTKDESVWLTKYKLEFETQISGIEDNLSGITYSPDTNSFWVIVNRPQRVLELDQQLQVKREIKLANFRDTEALAYAGGGRFLIVDEREQTIVVAPVTATTKTIDKQLLQHVTLNIHDGDNKGFEGIAVDTEKKIVYVVRERDPMMLLTFRGLLNEEPGLEIGTSREIDAGRLLVDDLSGLYFDAITGNLLFLSDESKAVGEVTTHGNKVSYMYLVAGFHGLTNDIPQAEGIAMGPDRAIYIVSEPNLIYRFSQ